MGHGGKETIISDSTVGYIPGASPVKINMPVTQTEFPLPRGETLVSKTDLKGSISYANDVFINASGYSREELVGSNHNLVRHPDMPQEAFSDLWETIKAGRPWRGIVKNRRKNGDHYWVKALVVPVRKQDKTIGYMSVRSAATAAEQGAAAALYQAVAERKSRLSRTTIADLVFRLSFATRFALFVTLMTLLGIAAGISGLNGLTALTAVTCATSFAVALGSIWFMSATISRPLQEAIGYFDQIAQGNLSSDIPVNRPDEVGRVLAGLAVAQTHMRVMIDEIRLGAEAVDQRCERLEQEVQVVTEVSCDQSDRVSRVSGSMDQLSSSVAEVAQTSAGAADSARTTLEVVNEGNLRMELSIAAADQVGEAVQAFGAHIEELSTSIGQIGTMAGAIKDIADQTNLLALNAAIEAARAGEQGRGFAVVADEVRKLAERTAHTTGDINRMVQTIQATTGSAVTAMANAVDRVQDGRGLIEQTHQSFKNITRSSERVTEVTDGIAVAARAQSVSTGEVAANTEQMARLIEMNSASIVQVRDAVGELKRTADQLRDMVAHFQVNA